MLERAERKRFAGDGEIFARRGRNQQEDAAVRAAFVQLSGRVQIPWTVREHRRCARPIADRTTQREQFARERRAVVEIGEEREIVTGAEKREQRVGAGARELRARGGRQRQRDAVIESPIGRGNRQRPARLVAGEQRVRRILRLLHVRLIERVDLQDRARDRRCTLPADELGAECGFLRKIDLDDGRLAGFESTDGLVARGFVVRIVGATRTNRRSAP